MKKICGCETEVCVHGTSQKPKIVLDKDKLMMQVEQMNPTVIIHALELLIEALERGKYVSGGLMLLPTPGEVEPGMKRLTIKSDLVLDIPTNV